VAAPANLVRDSHLQHKVSRFDRRGRCDGVYLVIDVQILEKAFFFRRGYLYEVRGGELEEDEERRKPEQEASPSH
jgi:hypothetical protein